MARVRAHQELDSSALRQYALVGAQARLEAITSEFAAIRQAFPELANGNAGAAWATDGSKVVSRRRRGRMTTWSRKSEPIWFIAPPAARHWAHARLDHICGLIDGLHRVRIGGEVSATVESRRMQRGKGIA